MTAITRQILNDVESMPPEMQEEALDFVIFLKGKLSTGRQKQKTSEPNGKKIAEIMERIAQRGTAFSHIEDPAAWQREIRKDRPLPGRDE